MPRRPRPASRQAESSYQNVSTKAGPSKLKPAATAKRSFVQPEDESDSESENDSDVEGYDAGISHISADEDMDLDAPRVAQWVDEDELEGTSGSERDDDDVTGEHVNEEEGAEARNDLVSISYLPYACVLKSVIGFVTKR